MVGGGNPQAVRSFCASYMNWEWRQKMFVFKMILPSMHGYKEFLNYVPDSCHNSQSLEFFREHAPLQNNAACYRNIIQFRYLLNSNGVSTAFSIDNPVSRRVSLFRQKPL